MRHVASHVTRSPARHATRHLGRLVAAAALVAAGGLALPGGAAQAAACSGTTGVTVVIDYGSSSTTSCAAGDPSSAMSALKAVATVVSPQRYPGTVVCRINGTPASDPCIQMPPASAYWAFFHAPRGGSWTYSQSGVASYNPAPGTVIGFAFGSGGKPDTAPPAAASAPKPSSSSTPKPSTRPSASSTPRATSSAKPRATSSPRSTSAGTSANGTAPSSGSGTTAKPSSGATKSGSPATTKAAGKPAPSTPRSTGTATASDSTASTATSGTATTGGTEQSAPDTAAQAATTPDSGSPTTLAAGIGLIGVVGAAAAYLTHRRRTHG